MIKLSILIPTIESRAQQFNRLIAFIENNIDKHNVRDGVEIISLCDNKERTIGEKREHLYQLAQGLYAWQLDDDDAIDPEAVPLILAAMETDPDCITFQEACNIDGNLKSSNFSLKYSDWGENIDGFDYVRTPFFKTPIKTALCQQAQIPHIRFGEDIAFARNIYPLLKTEVHIPLPLYYYNHDSTPFNERYGIVQ
jgi:hypothetical protein